MLMLNWHQSKHFALMFLPNLWLFQRKHCTLMLSVTCWWLFFKKKYKSGIVTSDASFHRHIYTQFFVVFFKIHLFWSLLSVCNAAKVGFIIHLSFLITTVEWVVQPIWLSLGGSRATARISCQFISGPQRDVQSFEITFMDNLYFPIDLARLSSTVGASGSREPANFRCESTNVFILEAYKVTVTRWQVW